MTNETMKILLMGAPLAIGGIIAAINEENVNSATERADGWCRRTQTRISARNDPFSRYFINPILWVIVKLSDLTGSIAHRSLKNGLRVAAALYVIVAVCYLIYAAVMIAVAIFIAGLVIYIVFKVLVKSDDDVKRGYQAGQEVFDSNKQDKQEDVNAYVGLKGKKIYTGTNWFNEDLKGRVDDEGNIYKGTNWLNEEKIGRIDSDGNVYQGTSSLNEEKVGRIDEAGNLHKGTNWFNEEKTGRIDEDGNIHKGTNLLNEEQTGRTGQ